MTYNTDQYKNRLLGGLYGLAIGDAVGVPFEFNDPKDIPLYQEIDIVMAPSFSKTYPHVPYGTWSDDTSLALCLLDSLLQTTDWESIFVKNMLDWRSCGKYAVDSKKFDIGIQTSNALSDLANGQSISDRVDDPNQCGNGALMRSLPTALVAVNSNIIWYLNSIHTKATHATETCVAVNTLYGLLAFKLLQGIEFETALDQSSAEIEKLSPEIVTKILNWSKTKVCKGTGYVIDSFWTAIESVRRGSDFKSTIQIAIAHGHDTDTTACIAGGLAGIIYGYDHLPEAWLTKLRNVDLIDQFADRLLKFHE